MMNSKNVFQSQIQSKFNNILIFQNIDTDIKNQMADLKSAGKITKGQNLFSYTYVFKINQMFTVI